MAGKTPLLAYEVKYMREWLGLNLQEFGKLISKPPGFVDQVEQGERPVTEDYIIAMRTKFGYIPLSDHFKKGLGFVCTEPPTTAVRKQKETSATMFDLMGE